MSAHRYWRLNFITNNGGSAQAVATALAEVQLCTADSTNRVGTGTGSAASSYAGQPASYAFDGNTATFWSSNGPANPMWLAYDFGAGNAWDIQQVTLTTRNDGYWASQSPVTFYVQYSDDGVAWTNYWYIGISQVATWGQSTSQTFTYYVPLGQNPRSLLPAVQPGSNGPNIVQVGRAPTPGPKTVSGTVTVNGVATAGLLVRAYAKATGELIGQATTVANGSYAIKCGANWADVEVIAFDPTTYQALVYDRVVPA